MTGWHLGLPDLVCPGFRLREPRLADAELLPSAIGPKAAAAFGIAAPETADGWSRFIARVRSDRGARHTACYAVVPDGSAAIRGLLLLQRLAPRSRAVTVSFAFAETCWVSEVPFLALACVLAFAFKGVGVRRVEGRALGASEFEPARRLGAVAEGVLSQSRPASGGFTDQILWSVLSSGWVPRDDAAPVVPIRVERQPPAAGDSAAAGHDTRPAWALRLPTLKGSLVTLRELMPEDAPVLHQELRRSDLDLAFEPSPATPDEFRRYIAWVQAQRAEGRAAGFAIVPRGTTQAAGVVQVRRAGVPDTAVEWGIVLAPTYQGTSAAAEAARLAAAFAFETLGAQRLETRTSALTPAFGALLRKLGAVREARLRQSFAYGDTLVDDELWAILKRDWQQPPAGLGAPEAA